MIKLKERFDKLQKEVIEYNRKEEKDRKYELLWGLIQGLDISTSDMEAFPATMNSDTDKSTVHVMFKPIGVTRKLSDVLKDSANNYQEAKKLGYLIERFFLEQFDDLEEFIHKNMI